MSAADRRQFLAGSGLLLGFSAAGAAARAPAALPEEPAAQLRALVRVVGNTADEESYWRGNSTIYAYTPDGTIPLLKTESGERSWWRRDGDQHVRFSASITRFLDPITGRPVEEFENPITGRPVALSPGRMRRQGGEVFTARGSYFPISRARFPDMYDDKPLQLDWTSSDDVVRISRIENFAPVVKRSMYEVRTYFAPVADALDDSLTSAAAASAGWFVSSYSRWLDMADAPGHMLWHFESLKVRTLGDFGKDFLTWARTVEPRFDRSPELDEGPSYIDQVADPQ